MYVLYNLYIWKTADDNQIGILSFCYGLYHQLDAFRTNYHEQYGAEPYVNPTTRWRW